MFFFSVVFPLEREALEKHSDWLAELGRRPLLGSASCSPSRRSAVSRPRPSSFLFNEPAAADNGLRGAPESRRSNCLVLRRGLALITAAAAAAADQWQIVPQHRSEGSALLARNSHNTPGMVHRAKSFRTIKIIIMMMIIIIMALPLPGCRGNINSQNYTFD